MEDNSIRASLVVATVDRSLELMQNFQEEDVVLVPYEKEVLEMTHGFQALNIQSDDTFFLDTFPLLLIALRSFELTFP